MNSGPRYFSRQKCVLLAELLLLPQKWGADEFDVCLKQNITGGYYWSWRFFDALSFSYDKMLSIQIVCLIFLNFKTYLSEKLLIICFYLITGYLAISHFKIPSNFPAYFRLSRSLGTPAIITKEVAE